MVQATIAYGERDNWKELSFEYGEQNMKELLDTEGAHPEVFETIKFWFERGMITGTRNTIHDADIVTMCPIDGVGHVRFILENK